MSNATTTTTQPREAGAVYLINRPKANAIEVSTKPAKVVARHEEEFCYMDMGSLKMSKMQKRIVPERILVGGYGFDINAIEDAKPYPQGTEALRMSDDDAREWYELVARHEAQRATMKKETEDFKRLALKRARRVRKSDCVS